MSGQTDADVGAAPRTIDAVIERMEEFAERFEADHGPRDGVLCFNKLYLAVTRGVKKASEEPGYFDNPTAIEALDVLFAGLYFDAVEALESKRHKPTLAWRVLFHARSKKDILPLQFAIAGMNAHINHDLPFALMELWDQNGGRPGHEGAPYSDYTKVNQILKQEELKMGPGLEPAELLDFDRGRLDKLENRLALWVVDAARAQAWDTASHLWEVRKLKPVRDAWIGAVDVSVGALGRTLLQPL